MHLVRAAQVTSASPKTFKVELKEV